MDEDDVNIQVVLLLFNYYMTTTQHISTVFYGVSSTQQAISREREQSAISSSLHIYLHEYEDK